MTVARGSYVALCIAAVLIGASVACPGPQQQPDFGGAVLQATNGNGSADLFVAKLAADNTHLWSRSYGGIGVAQGPASLSASDTGDVFAAGQLFGSVAFCAGALTAQGAGDVVVLKLGR